MGQRAGAQVHGRRPEEEGGVAEWACCGGRAASALREALRVGGARHGRRGLPQDLRGGVRGHAGDDRACGRLGAPRHRLGRRGWQVVCAYSGGYAAVPAQHAEDRSGTRWVAGGRAGGPSGRSAAGADRDPGTGGVAGMAP
eukprot:7314332-Pyramimonas_sp.AAC.1